MPQQAAIEAGSSIDRYEVMSLLSAGGMGEVYRARDPLLERELVLKVLPQRAQFQADALERFVREARAASALNHPNIVTIYAIGEADNCHFIAMELVKGKTLRQLGKERATARVVAQIGSQAARALAVAHEAGIVHRDIKPENIMVRDDGYVKVLDFGIAQLAHTDGSGGTNDSRLTRPGMVVGTMRYMSPEQATADEITPASDIFSLGIVLHELATGRHPFEASSDMAVLSSIILRDAPAPSRTNPRLPREFDAVIGRMLSKNPLSRPTAIEVATLLAGIAEPSSSTTTFAGVPARGEIVGRELEKAALRDDFAIAASGRATMTCVSGEPGIGKTTLVEDFLAELTRGPAHLVARGRCSERLAGAEAYLPILDALEDLLNEDPGGAIRYGTGRSSRRSVAGEAQARACCVHRECLRHNAASAFHRGHPLGRRVDCRPARVRAHATRQSSSLHDHHVPSIRAPACA